MNTGHLGEDSCPGKVRRSLRSKISVAGCAVAAGVLLAGFAGWHCGVLREPLPQGALARGRTGDYARWYLEKSLWKADARTLAGMLGFLFEPVAPPLSTNPLRVTAPPALAVTNSLADTPTA